MIEPISREAFEAWREARPGEANPTRMDNPLWESLVHDRINAYQVLQRFGRERQRGDRPTWCFDRFGQSTTQLSDGRTVYIAGEHEDYYDADFYIYNDVVVVEPGGQVAIYGYSHDAFPATDFHTASLVGEHIWIVGNLSYIENRKYGTTQVCRLDLATMAMTRLTATGEAPGWISRHEAAVEGGAIVIRGGKVDESSERVMVENIDTWALELETLVWTRRTRLDWQRWIMRRADAKRNLLWDIRQWAFAVEYDDSRGAEKYRAEIERGCGRAPDLDQHRTRYLYDSATSLPQREDEYNVFRVELDGVTVRFTETSHHVAVIVEGRLAEDRLAGLQRHVLDRLDALDNTDAWRVEP